MDFKKASIGGKEYTCRADGAPIKIWIVVRQGSSDTLGVNLVRIGAYFREDLARAHLASLATPGGMLLGLEVVHVLDLPKEI